MRTSIFQNSNENIVRISALKVFIASLCLPGDLVSNIINKEAYRKPQVSYINFQSRNSYNIFVAILENRCPHQFIMSLTDLQREKIISISASIKEGQDQNLNNRICTLKVPCFLVLGFRNQNIFHSRSGLFQDPGSQVPQIRIFSWEKTF